MCQHQNAFEYSLVIHKSGFIELKDLPNVVLEELAVKATLTSLETDVLQTGKAAVERAIQEPRSLLRIIRRSIRGRLLGTLRRPQRLGRDLVLRPQSEI